MINQMARAYSIKEVSKKISIPTGTIRQWEKDLTGLLVIPRTKQGARYYTDLEVELLTRIKEMREKNVGKEMIRTLLEKHLTGSSEPTSERFEISVPLKPEETPASTSRQNADFDHFYRFINDFKLEMLNEFRKELEQNRFMMLDDMKNELSKTALQTVNDVSKSIQRSNDKRKAEMQQLTEMVKDSSIRTSECFESLSADFTKASELTSETFGSVSSELKKNSKQTSEKLAALSEVLLNNSEQSSVQIQKQLHKVTKIASLETSSALKNMVNKAEESNVEIRNMTSTLEKKQQELLDSIKELRMTKEDIQNREEVFQGMLNSFREVAAAKKKKWWQVWR